jgi:quinol monooxygenase YgiN
MIIRGVKMITLNVTYYCKPGKREEFIDALKRLEMRKNSRGEAGNIKYDYFVSLHDPNRLFLLEQWRDDIALTNHGGQPFFKKLGSLKETYVEETVIEKYYQD